MMNREVARRLTIGTAMLAASWSFEAGASSAFDFDVDGQERAVTFEGKLEFERENDGDKLSLPELTVVYAARPGLELEMSIANVRATGSDGASARGLGDTEAKAKWTIAEWERGKREWTLLMSPEVTLPTGNADRGLGDGATTIKIPFVIGSSLGPVRLFGELGYEHEFGPDGGTQVPLGIAATLKAAADVKLGLEVKGEFATARPKDSGLECQLAFKWDASDRTTIGGEVGRSLRNPDGTVERTIKLEIEVTFE